MIKKNLFSFFHFFIGESLVRRSLSLSGSNKNVEFCEGDAADVIEGHEWKCVRTLRGTLESLEYWIHKNFKYGKS